VRKRLDDGTASTLTVYAEGFALVLAALTLLFPPLGLVGIALLLWLLIGGRRRAGEKYAGLRILR
jgi:threonine/homoserine/homoserine lactone efflux protein